jgi:2-polyprenyl-3-methyl-5-hydroxy-6-metoxy-1,4-benzoquinol methylase
MAGPERAEFEDVPACLLCSTAGTLRYSSLRDWMFGAPGTAQLLRCPECGLLWLSPRLTRASIGLAYGDYYTHQDLSARFFGRLRAATRALVLEDGLGDRGRKRPIARVVLGGVLSAIPFVAERVEPLVVEFRHRGPQRLLDVGSGDGVFLAAMQGAGWDVSGLEPDPVAARRAREKLGVRVLDGSLDTVDPGAGAFDVVTARHVLEHVHDPVAFLTSCYRALRPGGRLIVLTPNSRSYCHRIFGRHWQHLDPPRHLHVFSRSSLEKCAAAARLRLVRIRSLGRWSRTTWQSSRLIRRDGHLTPSQAPVRLLLEGACFAVIESLLSWGPSDVGEELLLIAAKPAE